MEYLVKEDTTLMINILTGMGAFYLNKSIKIQKSIQYFERVLKLAEMLGNDYNIGRTYNALGFLYGNLENYEIAESFYQKGFEIFEKLNNKAEVCWLYTQMGELHTNKKDFDKALNYLEKALEIVHEIDVSVMQTTTIHMTIGLVHRERGENYNSALQFFEKALALAKSIGNNYLVSSAELAIGECNVLMKNFSEGKRKCKIALEKGKQHLLTSQKACDCLYKASQGIGDFKLALTYHKQFKVLTDSLHNEELSEKINNLAAKQAYEMELAEMQKTQELAAVNTRTKLVSIIGIISFLALLIIMSLYLSNVKKTAQKKQLQALSIVRKEMVANVSHDLRTPITVMVGYIETLLMRLGKSNLEDQEKYLNIILSNAERLSKLIGQLFEYSKLEAQQIEPMKESFQLKDLVKDIFSQYQIIAEKKQVQIEINCTEDIPMVYADSILIERVIQNLIDNALKFTPQHGVVAICLSNNNNQVQVEISDTGKGISKEKEQLIFNRYEKSKKSNGAGLGLTIVKDILELHESTIRVNSKLNEGTTFAFDLPTG